MAAARSEDGGCGLESIPRFSEGSDRRLTLGRDSKGERDIIDLGGVECHAPDSPSGPRREAELRTELLSVLQRRS